MLLKQKHSFALAYCVAAEGAHLIPFCYYYFNAISAKRFLGKLIAYSSFGNFLPAYFTHSCTKTSAARRAFLRAALT